MAEHWKPTEFKDTYHEDLMRRIKEKIKAGQTKEITKPESNGEAEPRSAKVIDLAALLRESLKDGGRGARNRKRRADAAKRTKAVVRSLPRARAAEPKAKRKSA